VTTILGIDPGLNHVGYGILRLNEECVIQEFSYGIYDINAKKTRDEKLFAIYNETALLIKNNNVSQLALELNYHNPKRAKGSLVVREAVGVIKSAAFTTTIEEITAYTPQRVKKQLTGNGSAGKEEISQKMCSLLGIEEFFIEKRLRGKMQAFTYGPSELIAKKLDHVTDGLAIAYCRKMELSGEEGSVANVV
jgi:crossover junction endodeoxyribonuclease RuvC